MKQLDDFRQVIAEDDEALVYLACRSIRRSASEGSTRSTVVICPSDFDDKVPDSVIQPGELHQALASLSRQVLVVIDSCYGGGLIDHARRSESYTLLSSTYDDQKAEERPVDGVVRGVFSAAFVAVLRGLVAKSTSAEDVVKTIALAMPVGQTPLRVGSEPLTIFSHLQQAASAIAALAYSQRQYFGASCVAG